MKTINLSFKNNQNANCAFKCIPVPMPALITGFTHGYDKENGDVLFFFNLNEIPIKSKNDEVVKFLSTLKDNWQTASFKIIEDRISYNGECVSIGFDAHLFRLRKN